MDKLSAGSSILIGSPNYPGLEKPEETSMPAPSENGDEELFSLLLTEETALNASEPVEFRQFPSTLYAHTEDGTPFERLTQLTRSKHQQSVSQMSSQETKLTEDLQSLITQQLSRQENIKMPTSDVDSVYWNQMLHEVLFENLDTSQMSDSVSHQLKEAILQHLDEHLSSSQASDLESVRGSLKSFLNDVPSGYDIHGSVKHLLYDQINEHASFHEHESLHGSVETNLKSSKGSTSIKSEDAKKVLEQKLRNLNVRLDTSFVKKELEHLCNSHSVGNILCRPFESKLNDKFIDQYNLEYADMNFLEKSPKNFIIFNKPGIDTSNLAKKMQDQYGLVILDPKTVLEVALSQPSELQEKLSEQLGKGQSVDSNTLFNFILKEINTSSKIKHNGYILSGIPMFRFCDNVENDDLISPRDQLEAIFAVANRPNMIIYLYCPDPCLIRLRSLTNTDSNTGHDHNLGISRTVKIHKILQAEFLQREIDQLEYTDISTEGEEEEDGVIRDRGSDENIMKGYIFNETHDTNPKYPNLPSKHVLNFLLKDFEDASKNLTSSFKSVKAQNLVTNIGLQTIKYFHNAILPIISEYVLLHDLQYYVKLDARLPSNQNFKIIQRWLNKLNYMKPCKAYSLLDRLKNEGKHAEEYEYEEEKQSEGERYVTSTLMSMYKEVEHLNCIDSFNWKLSPFGVNCPVSLFNGIWEIGKTSFSATYLDHVYFCKSKTCLEQFIEDPKKYIKEPNPKPTYKLIIVGFTGCDIQTISQSLCEHFYLKYIEFNSLLEKYITTKKNKTLDYFKIFTKNKFNETKVFEAIKNKMLEREINKWKKEVLNMIQLKIGFDDPIGEEEEGGEGDDDDDDDEGVKESSLTGLYDKTGSIYHILNDEKLCEMILLNNKILDEHVPENLEEIVEAKCQQKIEELAELAILKDFDSRLSLEDVRNAISSIDDSNQIDDSLYFVNDKLPAYRGWVLNGLPIDPKLWALLLRESNVFNNEIIFLYNSNDAPLGENLGEKPQSKPSKIELTVIDIMRLPKDKPKNYNGFNRKKLASIQERCKNFIQTDDRSISEAPSSFIIEEEEVQEDDDDQLEIKETSKRRASKRITFQSQVDIIPSYSDKLEYYDINDRIFLNWTNVKTSVLSNLSSNILEIDVLQNTDVLEEIENHVLEKCKYPVIDLEDTDKKENAGSDSNVTLSDFFTSRILGDTMYFCPVVLKEHKQLIQGDRQHSVQYKNKLYYFISTKNKEKFKLDPDFYVDFKTPLHSRNLGSWTVCVLATVCGSGELFCQRLASNLNLTFVNFNIVLQRDIVPVGILPIGIFYEDPETIFELAFKDKAVLKDLQVLRDYFNSLTPLPQKELTSLLVDKYWTFQHPCSNGFIYYRFPHTVNDFKYLVSKMFLPDVIIELKVSEDLIQRSMRQIKLNWTVHKGAIKSQIILHDQNLKLEYEKVRKRVFRIILNTVWSREISLKEKGTIDLNEDSILERIEAEIQYAKGNTHLLEALMLKYAPMDETEELALSEDDANSLFHEVDEANDDIGYSNIKKISSPLEHSPSIKNIAIRYGLEPKDIDLNVVKQVHKIVCQIVPKPNYKMKTLKQKINDPENDIMSTHETELEEISKIKRVAKKLNIPWISSTPSEDDATKVCNNLRENICRKDPYCLENVYEISMESAEKLLEMGYFYLSKYGRLCPVEFHYTKNSLQPFEKRRKQNEIHALVHRKYIYFIYSDVNREKFMRNVLKYVKFNSNVDVFSFPIKLAVIGTIKSGKSSLAKVLADFYDLEVITIGSALRYVQRNLSWTLLADHIEICLAKGCLVPDVLVAKSIEVVTHVGKAPVTGYVLDGVIRNENLIHELTKLNVIPHLVINLNVQIKRIITNLRTSELPERMFMKYSTDFINYKLKKRGFPSRDESLIDTIRLTWYNVLSVDPITIQLNLDVITSEISNISLMINENYAQMKHSNKGPIKLKYMCVSPYEYESRLNCLIENSCVGCLVENKQFVSKCLDRMNSLLYKGNYFWLCPIHYEPFLRDPEQFFCKLDPAIFLDKPRKVIFPKQKDDSLTFLGMAENKGYCNVCFWNYFPNRIPVVKKGLPHFGVLYREKLFLFCCDHCMQTFCLRPQFYHDKQIHCTLPLLPVEQPYHIPPKELPLVGYIHENLADFLQEAIVSVGHMRPKYPFMSPHLSAVLYLGYYLASKAKFKHRRRCITNSFEDEQYQQFLARINVLKLLVDTLPWNYNPFLIKLWLKEGKTEDAFRRNLKTKAGSFIVAIEAIPDEFGKVRTYHDRGDGL